MGAVVTKPHIAVELRSMLYMTLLLDMLQAGPALFEKQ